MQYITKLFFLILCLTGSTFAAESTAVATPKVGNGGLQDTTQTVEVAITSGGDERLQNFQFAHAEMKCAGLNNAYTISSTNQNHLYVTGPFVGDKRNTCKLIDDDVYFKLHNIIISFDYEGTKQECILTADIGTSNDAIGSTIGSYHDKLQSEIVGNPHGSKELKETPAMCIGNPKFTYKVIQGSREAFVGYDKGRIEIHHVDSPRVSDAGVVWTLYVNGIMNSIDDAMLSSLAMASTGPKSDGANLQYGLLYNRSNGIISDTNDLTTMKMFDSYIANGSYIKVYEKTTGVTNCNSAECQKAALDWYLTMVYTENGFGQHSPLEIYGHDFDSVWSSFLNYGIYPTDKILLVAHSQGNLYANVLTDYLKYVRAFPAENLNTLHVGVTSARTTTNLGNSSNVYKLFPNDILPNYITNVEDHIINQWRSQVRSWYIDSPTKIDTTKLEPLAGNFSHDGEPRLNPYLDDLMNHGFIEAYLNHSSTASAFYKMLNYMIAGDEYELKAQHLTQTGVSILKVRETNSPAYFSSKIDIYPPSGGNIGGLVGRKFLDLGNNIINGISPLSIEKGYYQIFTSPDYRYIINAYKPYDTSYCGEDTFEMIVTNKNFEITCGSTHKTIRGSIDSGLFRFSFYAKDSKLEPSNLNLFYAFTNWDYELIQGQGYNIPLILQFNKNLSYRLDVTPDLTNWHPLAIDDDSLGGAFTFKTDWIINTINLHHDQLCNYYEYQAKLICPVKISHFDTVINVELSAIVPFSHYDSTRPLNLTRADFTFSTRGIDNEDSTYRELYTKYTGKPAAHDELYLGFVEPDDN
ncbi:MAG: hypothetical protein K2Y14_10190 [Burkholderiales bacterium]|nr:hypothetical protein [Burkholderiales bacterium]